MIPKIIHYCWFGGNPLPESAKKCIASWRKFLPDYEIKEWNESNFDVNSIPYTAEAYKAKKYAFVSDYARFYILYKYGGLYFDTDVEVIHSMDDIVARGNFMGFESDISGKMFQPGYEKANHPNAINPGLGLGVSPGLNIIGEILKDFEHDHLYKLDGSMGQTIVYRTTRFVLKDKISDLGNGVYKCGEIFIYATDYFCPKDYITGELHLTPRTRSIHQYSATWVNEKKTIISKISRRLHAILYHLYGSLRLYKF
jgi:hypothetical protein